MGGEEEVVRRVEGRQRGRREEVDREKNTKRRVGGKKKRER